MKSYQMESKNCTQCHELKNFSEFSKDSHKINGIRSACKACVTIQRLEYLKTKDGLLSRMYSNQKVNSDRRKHNLPIYTKEEFKDWLFSQELFNIIYDKWVKSGYEKDLKPSVDRLDDYKGYSFDNIRLITWGENRTKQNDDIRLARSTSGEQCKAVLQFDKQMNLIAEFCSANEAARELKIFQGNISATCAGRRKIAGGFIWKYKTYLENYI